METLITGAVFTGTLDGLSRAFDLSPEGFLACLRELVHAGRLAVVTYADNRLTVRLERRSASASPVAIERRRPAPSVWRL
jgi:hypothetical protein